MADPRIEQLASLPQHPAETWQGGLVRLPGWITGEPGPPYRAVAAMWIAKRADKVHAGKPVHPKERNWAMIVDTLLEFALETPFGGYRPGRIEVADSALAEHLAGLLAETGIEVSVVERLDALQLAVESLEAGLHEGRKPFPGPLSGEGVTLERVQRFADAAAAFYRAAPWQYLTDVDLIHIEQPKGPTEMRHAIVLGAGGSVFGLGFYRTAADHFQLRQAAVEGERTSPGLWQFSLNPITEIPFADADLWEDHGLPAASPDAYPLLMRFGPGRRMRRAGAVELSHTEAWLWAMAATSEAEIDSGRWDKEVTTYEGLVHVTLAIPDLLKPPTHQAWVKRGFMPDRRSMERGFADMDRYFARHPAENIDELNAVLESQFAGKSIDELTTPPETPPERAQDLCFQAFATHGRRRVQLARQALEIYPDCADAYVILAELAATPQKRLDYYTQGMAAGERALGKEAFEGAIGDFWGVTETRPYMRARFGLGQTLQDLDRLEEAAGHYQELLRLNPNDNQGVRYVLLPLLLRLGRDADAARLLKQFDEQTANWAYARALIAFRLSGRSTAAGREFRAALRANPFVPRLLLTEEELPSPEGYSFGSVEEAILCVQELKPAFKATEGAMEWLAAEESQGEKARSDRQKEQRRKERQKRKKGKGR